jgi:uncharacterized protein YbjT (DUF2867 family)
VITPVTVVGGAGRTGRLVAEALLDQGAEVRVVSRHASRARDLASRGAALHDADVRTGDGLADAVRGARAVVYSIEPGTSGSGPDRPETTMYQGVLHVLEHCDPALARFVLVSQIYVTRPGHSINQYGRLLDWRLRGEDAVRASGLPYTVVRPSWLTGGAAGGRVRLEQGDRGDGQITRADVAAACVSALSEPTAAGKTFELYNEPGAARPWPELFAALAPDPRPDPVAR